MGGVDCSDGSVIAAVKPQGRSLAGIVNYLLGPGRSDEHVDQRVAPASADVEVAVGQTLDDNERRSLSGQLSLWPAMFRGACPSKGEVYHVVFSLPEGEQLTDGQWAQVAGEMAEVLHLERPSGATGSWAAFCHGPSAAGFDHMHFVCGLVRSDGSKVKTYLRHGYAELHAVARRAEQRFGLRTLVEHGEGSVPVAQRAEREACARRWRPEPERATLARAVRSTGQAARDEAEFVDQLRAGGVLVRPRYSPGRHHGGGRLLGSATPYRGRQAGVVRWGAPRTRSHVACTSGAVAAPRPGCPGGGVAPLAGTPVGCGVDRRISAGGCRTTPQRGQVRASGVRRLPHQSSWLAKSRI